jgi:hypothetical protein
MKTDDPAPEGHQKIAQRFSAGFSSFVRQREAKPSSRAHKIEA